MMLLNYDPGSVLVKQKSWSITPRKKSLLFGAHENVEKPQKIMVCSFIT